tara:strand:- start:3742 stop:4920 length:1179 start_codon:yes stop_codon:yes gene_type:complete
MISESKNDMNEFNPDYPAVSSRSRRRGDDKEMNKTPDCNKRLEEQKIKSSVLKNNFQEDPDFGEFIESNFYNDGIFARIFGFISDNVSVDVADTDMADELLKKLDKIFTLKRLRVHQGSSGHLQIHYIGTNSIVRISELQVEIAFIINDHPEVVDILDEYRELSEVHEKRIGVISMTPSGFHIKWVKPNLNFDINFDLNYNENFKKVSTFCQESLEKNENGIYLFHGKPGTGKTFYIRHLIKTLKRNVLYLPSKLVSQLDSPEFMSFLMDNSDSILIIEDAEELLKSREDEINLAMATLLNIGDGILGDILGYTIVCTFNMDIHKVDDALMRDGRLICEYEFKNLEMERAKILAESLGFSAEDITEDTSLAEIYNISKPKFKAEKVKDKMGF